MPEVSVIIPAYNAAAYLPAAIDSVLAQTYSDLEVLVIDDGSTDDTEAVMRGYGSPVRYFRQPNGGVSLARNRGIEESRGRYAAFLDADDTWFPMKLERQLQALREHPEFKLCYSAFLRVDNELRPLGVERGKSTGNDLESLLTRGNVVGSICTVLCERELFAHTGGFDPHLSQCADWDMWIRLAVFTPFFYLVEPLVTYRQHTANMSHNVSLLERDSWRVLEKGFAMPGLSHSILVQRQTAFARNYMVLAGSYYHAGDYGALMRCLAQALALDPCQVTYLLGFPGRVWGRWRRPGAHATFQ